MGCVEHQIVGRSSFLGENPLCRGLTLAWPVGSLCRSAARKLLRPPDIRRGVCLFDEGGGDVAEFAVGVLGNFGQDLEGLLGNAAAFAHQDAFGLLDDRAGVQGLLQLLGQGGSADVEAASSPTPTPGRSWAGGSLRTCGPRWCSTPSRGPGGLEAPHSPACDVTPMPGRNLRPFATASASPKSVRCPRLAPSVTASITPSPRR